MIIKINMLKSKKINKHSKYIKKKGKPNLMIQKINKITYDILASQKNLCTTSLVVNFKFYNKKKTHIYLGAF